MSVVKRWGMVTCYFKNAEVQEHFTQQHTGKPKIYFFFFVEGKKHKHISQ